MNKNTFHTVKLAKGEVHIYNFGGLTLHAYQTNDPLSDEVFVLEKAGKAVVLEPPCFVDNCRELAEYLAPLTVAGVLVAYHAAGASFLPDAPKYATQNAVDYGVSGGGKALIDSFTAAFGDGFDGSIHTVDHIIQEGPLTIGGMEFIIHQTPDAFDVELPAINAVYTHMLGHDCHSIVAGAGHADAIIGQLNGYLDKGFDLILTSHYTPEDLKDVQAKIDYLENLKAIAAGCKDAKTFKAAVEKAYPAYSGQNYLEMTAGFFFG